MNARMWLLPLVPAMLSILPAGCNGYQRISELRAELSECQARQRQLQEQLAHEQRRLADAQQHVVRLQGLGPEQRLEALPRIARIRLGRYTGGYDADPQRPGHEAVRVYLEPIDRQGSVIKAAGEVTVEVFDLAAPVESNLVARCHWSPEQLAQHWVSGFITSHYVLDCPWPAEQPPAHEELTVRVSFIDYLTGEQFTQQQTFSAELPARGQ